MFCVSYMERGRKMPSFNQEINMELELNEIAGVMKQIRESPFNSEVSKPEPSEELKMTAPAGLSAEQQLAFTLRDFVGTANSVVGVSEGSPTSLNLPYIDEPEEETAQRWEMDEERYFCPDTDKVLNNTACRLRRWRAASRKLRRSRLINDSPEGKAGSSGDNTELRYRDLMAAGRMSVSSGELLTLAPPPSAATAPPSPGYLNTPSLADQSSTEYFGSSPECYADTMLDCKVARTPAPPPGPRYKLATQCALRVCCFQHTRTVVDKILAAKFLRKWETHVICLLEDRLVSKTPSGLLENPLFYSSMQEVFCIVRWDTAGKYCLRIVIPNGSLILQANDAYSRDQWYHSIIWKRNMIRYRSSLSEFVKKDKDSVMKELKNMIDFVMTTPLQDESVTRAPMQILTNLLSERKNSTDWEEWAEQATSTAAPLLAERCASGELCGLLARLCRRSPQVAPLPALAPPVRRVLTRNVDFARAPNARRLVRDYISALSAHNSGASLVRRFVEVTHGGCATCPHPRAAPNLAAVALAALDEYFKDATTPHVCDNCEEDVLCFADIIENMCEYEDWLVIVSGVLQPLPLCPGAMRCPKIAKRLAKVMMRIAGDPRCAVHSCLAASRSARQNPPSWLKAAAPSDPLLALSHTELCLLWGDMLESLLNCCSKRKSFMLSMSKNLPDFLLVALTKHPAALESLCLMLEWEVVSGEQTQMEIIASLQATDLGQKYYKDLCERQQNLQRLQAEGGPRRLALPLRATDADVAALLETGALGNLECLSLAFTNVTSECAQHLIKLPSLRYLNLWATQFGDTGVQLIAEHLPRLQVLNLCETPVTDKGIEALTSLASLKRLNLNSTKLSAEACEALRQKLPHLQEFDVRYTEAW